MSSTDSSAEKRITGTSERREQIIQRLRAQGSVQVNDLSLLYGVSTVTIRNDLAFLEKAGDCRSRLRRRADLRRQCPRRGAVR